MADLVVIVGVVAFVAICMAYVVGCDRIIGPDSAEPVPDEADEVSLPSVPGDALMTADNIAGLVIAVLVTVYLVAALLAPDKF